jgi:hypothetical protein
MPRFLAPLFTGFAILFFGSIAMNVVWENMLAGRVYHCSDDVDFGFFTPGNWVHGTVTHVDAIDTPRPMSGPEVILRGWSEKKIWVIWSGMAFILSLLSVIIPARMLKSKRDIPRLRPHHGVSS